MAQYVLWKTVRKNDFFSIFSFMQRLGMSDDYSIERLLKDYERIFQRAINFVN